MIDPGRESGSRDHVFAGDGAGVRQVAYAKYTPPRWATWPTARALLTYSIPGIDARTYSPDRRSKEGMDTRLIEKTTEKEDK
jgi:hypothetical protein